MPNTIIPFILLYALGMFVLLYFISIKPAKKKNKEVQAMHNALKPGDEVLTIGGIYGTVLERRGDDVLLEVDHNTGSTMKVVIYAIQNIVNPSAESVSA